MQQEWDDLDGLIRDSKEEFFLGEEFNKRVLSSIRAKESRQKSYTAPLSMIAAGLLLLTIYTGGIQYNLINIKYKMKLEFITMQNSFVIENRILGE